MLITPGAQPAQTLAAALATPRRDLVLVVDQLEELFTATHAPAVVAGFLDQVVRLAESGHQVVLVVRADQLGGFTRSPAAARLVEQGLHLVTPMTGDELRAGDRRAGPAGRAAAGARAWWSCWSARCRTSRAPCRCCPTRWPRPGPAGRPGC